MSVIANDTNIFAAYWPQIVYCALLAMGFGVTLSRHGQAKTGKHSIFESILVLCIVLPLLYAGGFFG